MSARRAASASVVLATLLSAGGAQAGGFSYNPPGQLVAGSGDGRVDSNVYAPNMRFPIESGPAYANSQVWGVGGNSGPAGDQCDAQNFSYPWSDNYCETRTWDMPLCPAGTGHQGQDIRASDCVKNVHWAVAAESGTVTSVGSYSVYITAADGTRYDYLHMDSVQVAVGDDVTKGQHIGKVSNNFGGTATTVHLHFNLRQDVQGVGNVYVPPYLSLVTSYEALISPAAGPTEGSLDTADCAALGGWAYAPDAPDAAVDVRLYFDGEKGSGVVGHPFLAADSRDDLCSSIGSCDHGFTVAPPLSLFDGQEHSVHAYASDGGPASAELMNSPKSFQCAFSVPAGVRRKVAGLEAANAWRFSPFWDEIVVSDGVIASIDQGLDLGPSPEVVASEAEPEHLFVRDGDLLREIPDRAALVAWELDLVPPVLLPSLEALTVGPPLRARPIVLAATNGDLWLIDDPAEAAVGTGGASGAGGSGSGGGSGGGVDDGCSCRSAGSGAPSDAAWPLLFGVFALLTRRVRVLPRN